MRYSRYDCSEGCPVEACLELIGGKWKGLALYHLMDGPVRFNELKRRMGEVTQRMLIRQLRELEAHQLVERTIYAEVPPRVDYRLSAKGATLKPVLRSLKAWGERHVLAAPATAPPRAPLSARRAGRLDRTR